MWILENLKDKTNIWLKPGITITVGRKDSDILILNDRSVSRKHAKFHVEKIGINKTNDQTYKPQVVLKDLDSKFGTTVNMQRISGSVILSENSNIKFGAFSEYRLKYISIVVCFSSLTSFERAELTALAVKNGITLTKSWNSNCTHLIMNKIKVTQKVILALIYNKNIVNMKWLEDFENCDIKNFKLPNESNFFPLISENDIFEKLTPEIFRPNIKRKNLFKDITFVTFSLNQCNKLASIIEAANGSIVSLYDKMKNNEIKYINDLISTLDKYKNACMIEPSDDINDDQKQLIIDTGKFLNQRLINDSEIGFSVIYASTDLFTNKDILAIDKHTDIIKETQYIPTLANNSLVFNPQNDFSKSNIFSLDTNIKQDNKNSTILNEYNSDDSRIFNITNKITENGIILNDDNNKNIVNKDLKDHFDNDSNKSLNNELFENNSSLKIKSKANNNNNNNNNNSNTNTNTNTTTITTTTNNNNNNNNSNNNNSNIENKSNLSNEYDDINKMSIFENKNKVYESEHSVISEKSQNLSLFWDNIIDISLEDEKQEINDENKEDIENDISLNTINKSDIKNKNDTNIININTNNKNVININNINNFNFNSLHDSSNNTLIKQNDIENKNINKINGEVKNKEDNKDQIKTNDYSQKEPFQTKDNNYYNIENKPLFYKYDLIVNDQEIYNEEQVIENINETKKEIYKENRKRKDDSLFDNENESEEENSRISMTNSPQNNYQLNDELNIEVVVSFSDDLIFNKNTKESKNKLDNNNKYQGINFKRFKKSKYIKNKDVIDKNLLFYYEDNKVSEEWLMDNENKTKKSSEVMLVKTKTLLNTNSIDNDGFFSIMTHKNDINTKNDKITEDDIKKGKINKIGSSKSKVINKNKIKDEFLISDDDDDDDDDDDEKFVWN
ncbi:hypothetical protein BCR36DRAFT_407997 [Piromyces finnis]|uniref:FHA domain-containing protein n=1 Tax=Piromyces finnis TaxID=1754191 RepID=A0A1Y1VPD4_9FUNG|nr:hypothetical protein BCR36DRAFT_407997 [Piromyces finnis]|eukprot:ORX61012.1 hypothetical protein BCR36DRAFT_407997 [Piromyces finnis]